MNITELRRLYTEMSAENGSVNVTGSPKATIFATELITNAAEILSRLETAEKMRAHLKGWEGWADDGTIDAIRAYDAAKKGGEK